MANTVNDVMNVIASPDYGIKSIAGTSHEILAILQGTQNSKNNIHSIVNDVKTLLQKLVEEENHKKPIEINTKTPKINPKNIQDILDETKGIRKAIENLTKAFLKQSGKTSVGVAKLTDKASQKVADAMIKNIEKQKSGSGLSGLIGAFNKLKNISLKDIIIGKGKLKHISKIFKDAQKDLNIKEKDLNSIIKLINYAPELIKSLKKVSWRIDSIIKNKVINKLHDIFVGKNSLLTLSQVLKKNEKIFNSANKVAKDIKELVSSLNKVMKKLFFASLWAKLANNGFTSIKQCIDKLLPLSKKITKNKKDIKEGSKSAMKITALVGNLLITSIFLTIAAVVGVPALLGIKVLSKIINLVIPPTKKLAKNKKQLGEAVASSVLFVAFTGVMAVASLALATIAVTGIPALIGSIFLMGIVKLNIFTFKMINKSKKNIITGSVLMALMGVSLLIYGIALGKITKATEKVTWKQVGIIATTLVFLALATAAIGIPAVAPFIALGAVSMSILSIGLLIFGTALGKLSKATENLKMKQILIVSGSIITLGMSTAMLGMLTIPISLGSITLGMMSMSLYTFSKSLKLISDMGEVPMKTLHQVLNAMKEVRNFFIKNALRIRAIKNAKKYKKMMEPFSKTVEHLTKLKELGSIPLKLVHQTLNAMNAICDYYTEHPITKEAIKQARKYKKMMKPFGKTLKYFGKLTELGSVPMKLVFETLNAMSTIGNYYVENPITKEVIKQARRYKKMLKPFGKTLKYFGKLTELGSVPMKLVTQTLNAMRTIADYYTENPIEKDVIKQSRRYKKMLKPFGKTLKYFNELKNIGVIPMIAIKNIIIAMGDITNFYYYLKLSDNIESKSKFTETIVNNFTTTAVNIQDKFKDIKPINMLDVISIVTTCKYIANYYTKTSFLKSKKKIKRMNFAVEEFSKLAKIIKDNLQDFTESNFTNVKLAIKSIKQIVKFLKHNTLNSFQRRKAKKNIQILNDFSSSISNLSGIDQTKLSSIGDALTNALTGVDSIDLGKVLAVTNMFNAFNSINKSESIINKFTESIKEFTTTCKNLMEAMNYNTDAINNMESVDVNGIPTSDIVQNNIIEMRDNNNSNNSGGIRISNVDEIARTIAEKINASLSVDIPDTQVQLLINGTGGNEWTISRY